MNHLKVLKGISIYCLILGIFSIIVSFALLIYGLLESSNFYTLASILGILGGIFNIARFVIGLKAVGGEYYKTALIMGRIAVVGDGLAMVLSLLNFRPTIIIKVVYFILSALYVYCVMMLQSEDNINEAPFQTTYTVNRSMGGIEAEAEKFFK